jgi:hypothetical protein
MPTDRKPTVRPEADLSLVFSSLQRAGDHWAPGGTVLQSPKGWEATADLREPLPKDTAPAVREYIRGYLRELGWRATVAVTKTQVRITLSRL